MKLSNFDVLKIREDFPILSQLMNGKPLCYFDSAATFQKPRCVIEKEREVYEKLNANVHRGAYTLSMQCTDAYESVRPKVARFLGKSIDTGEIIFTSGTTDSLNLVFSTWGRENIGEGDVIAVTRMEHHANFVPWQKLAQEKKARFEIIEIDPDYRLDEASIARVLALKPKILAITAMSNVLGTINDLPPLIKRSKEVGAIVVVDLAQAVAHLPLSKNGSAIYGDADFLAFSGHKIGSPTGVGILWGKRSLLEKMPPYRLGGDMIRSVRDQQTTWNDLPWKFEAGTPHFAGVIALGETIDYLLGLGMEEIEAYEKRLTAQALQMFSEIPDLTVVGPRTMEARGSVISITLGRIHPHDLATYLDQEGIAIRAGHHCAQPLLEKLGLAATSRASLSFINTPEEITRLGQALRGALNYFGRSKERHSAWAP